jgi:lipopolysaccharide export system ATP-binding protein
MPEGFVLVAQSMGKWFGRREVLKGATLWARAGEITVLLGLNGSGKSTLIKVTAGVVRPDYGVVHFDGLAAERPVGYQLSSRGLCYLPDRGLLSQKFTLRQHLAMVQRRFGGDGDEVARELGVYGCLDRRPHQVSGGERRRAELAVAVLRSPSVLLADEPLAGITPADRDDIAGVLRTLARRGVALVVTGHDAPELLGLADSLTWMTAATTHQLGSASEALGHDQFVREYLGPENLRAAREELGKHRQGVSDAE